MVPDSAREVGQAAPDLDVDLRLAGDALKPEVGPERRSDESYVLHRHRPGVEQRDAMPQALAREFATSDVDFRPVAFPIPRDVDDLSAPVQRAAMSLTRCVQMGARSPARMIRSASSESTGMRFPRNSM